MNAQTAKDLPMVLIAVLMYGVIAVCSMLLCKLGAWRVGMFLLLATNFITFVMAFVALGRRGK